MRSVNRRCLLKQIRLMLILFISLCALLVTAPLYARTVEYPSANLGTLDLTNWDFSEQGTVDLKGEWEFYWQRFLQPEQIINQQVAPAFIDVPSTWRNKVINGITLSGDGYATYRLTIKLAQTDNSLKALKMPAIYTAYKMWVNGELVATNGILGTSVQEMKPQSVPSIVFASPANGKIDLVIQVANFNHIKGGLRNEIYLGTPRQILAMREHSLNLQMLLLGSMLIMGVYYLVHYIFRRNEKSSHYFGLYCLVVGMRLLFVGEAALLHLFPDFNWSLAKRLEYASLYSSIPLFSLFIYNLYPSYVSRRFIKGLVIVCSSLLGIVLLGPTKVYLQTLNFYQGIIAFSTIYYLYILIKAALDKQESSYLSAAAGFIFLLSVFNDILNYYKIIDTFDGLFALGLLVFLFSQSVILSKRFSQAITQAEELSEENTQMVSEITLLNRNLEDKISHRTAQLNEIIEILNKEIAERSEAEEKLRLYATTDIMTGLANRATGLNTLDTQLAFAQRNNWHLTVGFIDINNLKVVNDDFGHQVGDELIVNISNILKNQIRQSDTVSRIGGDEFLIIFPKCPLSEAEVVWQRVEGAITEFNHTKNKPYQISLSYGFAEFSPGEEITAQELVEIADSQMYRVKKIDSY